MKILVVRVSVREVEICHTSAVIKVFAKVKTNIEFELILSAAFLRVPSISCKY